MFRLDDTATELFRLLQPYSMCKGQPECLLPKMWFVFNLTHTRYIPQRWSSFPLQSYWYPHLCSTVDDSVAWLYLCATRRIVPTHWCHSELLYSSCNMRRVRRLCFAWMSMDRLVWAGLAGLKYIYSKWCHTYVSHNDRHQSDHNMCIGTLLNQRLACMFHRSNMASCHMREWLSLFLCHLHKEHTINFTHHRIRACTGVRSPTSSSVYTINTTPNIVDKNVYGTLTLVHYLWIRCLLAQWWLTCWPSLHLQSIENLLDWDMWKGSTSHPATLALLVARDYHNRVDKQ
jgi:hypothetical protein